MRVGWSQGQRFLTIQGRFQITAAPLAPGNPNPRQPLSCCHFKIQWGLLGGGAAPGASWSRVLPSLRRVPQFARMRIPGEVRRAAPEPRVQSAPPSPGRGRGGDGHQGSRGRNQGPARSSAPALAPPPGCKAALGARCPGTGACRGEPGSAPLLWVPGGGSGPGDRRDPEARPRDETRRLTLALLQGAEGGARGTEGRCSQVRVTLLSHSHHAFTCARLPKPGPRLTACLAMAAPAVGTSFLLFLLQEPFGSS